MTIRTLLTSAAVSTGLIAGAQNQAWTATDINGNTVDIAALVNSGKTVLVDISAHWCGPCWAWHNTHIMNKLYHDFGPEGTGDLEIIWVDGDAASSMALLQGGSGSQGDWLADMPFTAIGPNGQGNTLANIYDIDAYPTLFMHCPGSTAGVEIAREATWEDFLASWKNMCPVAFNNGAIDGHLLELENGEVCPGEHPFADVFNQGTGALTSATLELTQDGNVVETKQWTGSIAPFQHSIVDFETTAVTGTEEFGINLIVANDVNPAGNTEEATYSLAPDAPVSLVSLQLKTDNYGSETTWKLFDSNGGVVAQDPPGNYGNNTVYTYDWVLDPNECYTFKIYDQYGDGICCSYGNGYYRLRNTYGTADNFITGGQFGGEEGRGFVTPSFVGIEDQTNANGFRVWPNPTTGLLNMEFDESTTATVDVFNVLGERVMTSTFNTSGIRVMDLGALNNGMYYMSVMANGRTLTERITLSK